MLVINVLYYNIVFVLEAINVHCRNLEKYKERKNTYLLTILNMFMGGVPGWLSWSRVHLWLRS